MDDVCATTDELPKQLLTYLQRGYIRINSLKTLNR